MPQAIAIGDTSFVIALLNQNDQYHQASCDLYDRYDQILIPQPNLKEITYLIERLSGNRKVAEFLDYFLTSKLINISLENHDLQRISSLIKTYSDTRLDFADLCVVAIAERYQIQTILTLDHRDFSIVRPQHCDYLTLLPARISK
jgi:predicted nucleic acid-binding protein